MVRANQNVMHARRHDWGLAVPERQLWLARLTHAGTLVLLAAVLVGMFSRTPQRSSAAAWWLGDKVERAPQFAIEVEPEDTQLERGTSLLALARFTGELPADVDLLYREQAGDVQQIRMSKSLDDPLFAGRIAAERSL